MNLPPDPDPLDELVASLLAGTIGAKEREFLAERLRNDPTVRQRYVEHVMLHGMLHWELGSPERARLLEERRRAARSPWRRWRTPVSIGAAAAAALILIFVLPDLWHHDGITGQSPIALRQQPPAATLATLHAAQGAQWIGLSRVPGLNFPFHQQTLRLAGGTAELAFTGGASVILSGPVALELLGPHSARLLSGRLVARAPRAAHGFTIVSGRMEIVDLGTEFGVDTDASGTVVEVFEGAIAVGMAGAPATASEHLIGGQAIRLLAGRDALESAEFSSAGFTRAMASALIAPGLDSGMVAWWRLDETSGAIAHDASGKGHDGMLHNCTFQRDGVTGAFGRALHFDGVSTSVSIPAKGMGVQELTIQAWIRPETPQEHDAQILSQLGGFGLTVPDNHELKFYFWKQDASVPYHFEPGHWYHVAGTFDGRERAFYVNGICIGAVPSGPVPLSNHEFSMGNLSRKVPDYFHGCLADLRIYGRALSRDEVRLLYLRGCTVHP